MAEEGSSKPKSRSLGASPLRMGFENHNFRNAPGSALSKAFDQNFPGVCQAATGLRLCRQYSTLRGYSGLLNALKLRRILLVE